MKKYYEEPTMVKFLDPNYTNIDGEPFIDIEKEEDIPEIGGIAYHDVIICGCCGGTFEIDGYTEEEWNYLKFEELSWIDIVDSIIGD